MHSRTRARPDKPLRQASLSRLSYSYYRVVQLELRKPQLEGKVCQGCRFSPFPLS